MIYHQLSRALFALAFFVLLLYMVVEIIYMPVVQSDVIKGFLSLNNALLGKGANHQYHLSASGLLYKQFYAWHAPGQHILPYILGKPFHNIGYGIMLGECIALLGGSICYIRLLRKFDIPDVVIALSMLLIFLQRFFHGVLLVYKTSDIWLFFLVPALLLALVSYHREQKLAVAFCKYLPVVVLVHALGLFVKHSYAVFAVFATVFLFFNEMRWRTNAGAFSTKKLFYHTIPGLVFAAILAVFYVTLYSRGPTPLAAGGRPSDPGWGNVFLYPLITVLNAPFGFNGLLYRLPVLSVHDLANGVFSARAMVVGLIMICPVLGVLYKVWRDRQFPWAWKNLALASVAFYVIMWAYFVYSGADISNEDRLIFPAVMIVVPVMVHAMLKMKAGRIIAVYFTVSVIFSAAALYSLKSQYDTATAVNRKDVFNHFVVSDNNHHGRELAGIRDVLAGGRKDVLLVVKTPEEFFHIGLELPVVASEHDHYGKMKEIIVMNSDFLLREGFRRVYFVVPATCNKAEIPGNIRFIETKMRSYKLLCLDL